MYIKRDITDRLLHSPAAIQILLGPRQCGKSTLFAALFNQNTRHAMPYQEVTLDDLQLRTLANQDPALFLQQFPPPLLIDEAQYAPPLFFELKKYIDQQKKAAVFGKQTNHPKTLFRLTGSSQILMDNNVQESLAGRAAYYQLHTLSVHEILHALPHTTLANILFKGGWPELYTQPALSPVAWLNDYIRSYVEKDIILSAGIQKTAAFLTTLRLCAARTGQETDYTNIQRDSGVSSVTIKDWIGLLERAGLIYQLRPWFNNLSKRLVKRPKLYFLDTGLATRLQGWSESQPLLTSPQIGALFETLVVGEIIKFIHNYGRDWEMFFWRTRDGQEVDILLKTALGQMHAFEVKYAIHGISRSLSWPPAFRSEFLPQHPLVVITSGGQRLQLSTECSVLPIAQLHDYLLEID